MKLRLKFSASYTCEIRPESYPGGMTPEQMLALDIASAEEDPFAFLDGAEIDVTGEIID